MQVCILWVCPRKWHIRGLWVHCSGDFVGWECVAWDTPGKLGKTAHTSVHIATRLVVDFLVSLRLQRTIEYDDKLEDEMAAALLVPPDEANDDEDDNDGDDDDDDAVNCIDVDVDEAAAHASDVWFWTLPSAPDFRFLVEPTMHPTEFLAVPCPGWIHHGGPWDGFTSFCVSALPKHKRKEITTSFQTELKFAWREFMDGPNTTRLALPVELTPLQRLCVVRVLRPDQLANEVLHFTRATLSMPTLSTAFTWTITDMAQSSSCRHPLVVVADAAGSDAMDAIRHAATRAKADVVVAAWHAFSEDDTLDKVLAVAAKTGQWVVLRHAEANAEWVTLVDRLFETSDVTTFHWDFRVWLCVQDPTKLPLTLLQQAVTRFQTTGASFREQLLLASSLAPTKGTNADTAIDHNDVLRLAFLHALLVSRSQYGRLGWHTPLDVDPTEFLALVQHHLDPFAHVYGARITSPWDAAVLKAVLDGFADGSHRAEWAKIIPAWSHQGRVLATAGSLMKLLRRTSTVDVTAGAVVAAAAAAGDNKLSLAAGNLPEMPTVDDPSWCGLAKASAALPLAAKTVAFVAALQAAFQPVLARQLPTASAVDDHIVSRTDAQHYSAFEALLEGCQLHPDDASKCAMHYDTPMHAAVLRELDAFREIRLVLVRTLVELQDCLVEDTLMPAPLAAIHAAVQANLTPLPWLVLARSTQTNLAKFQAHLLRQMKYFEGWLVHGPPDEHWAGAFLYPKHFFTTLRQHFARSTGIALQAIGVKTTVVVAAKVSSKDDDDDDDGGQGGAAAVDHAPSSNLPHALVTGLELMGVAWEQNDPEKKLMAHVVGHNSVGLPLTLRFSAFVVTEYDSLFDDSESRLRGELPVPIVHERAVAAAAPPMAVTSLDMAWYECLPVEHDVVGVAFLASAISAVDLVKRGAYIRIGD
ncbi:Aste57867_13355 [Aphanomyces stellatus]|uniref:Aste57867_13355 protein n=1 Tax=Aphanomyces stellatus TaxID=120398 RepID=A0A485KYE5_9STRA|nr:hypothetical protein As57867_013305 [Aphanomyces stellatus]VFT90194.1 Aste57867_13355 [Aphanomyces stellatus]